MTTDMVQLSVKEAFVLGSGGLKNVPGSTPEGSKQIRGGPRNCFESGTLQIGTKIAPMDTQKRSFWGLEGSKTFHGPPQRAQNKSGVAVVYCLSPKLDQA